MASDFDWYSEESREDIVFHTVQAVSVYQNAKGDVVIRQQHAMGGEDSIVVVPVAYVNSLVSAINSAASE